MIPFLYCTCAKPSQSFSHKSSGVWRRGLAGRGRHRGGGRLGGGGNQRGQRGDSADRGYRGIAAGFLCKLSL